jgi:prephenate dehydratase
LSLLKKENLLAEEDINRASLKFELDHKRGSLAAVLNVMSDCKMNLTKFNRQGRNAMEIFFFVDVTFEKYADYVKTKAVRNYGRIL